MLALLAIEIVPAILLVTVIGLAIAFLLQSTAEKYPEEIDDVVKEINKLLPQTQCAQCDYPGCKPYAEAVAKGEEINHCPPGGEELIRALADLLGREYKALDTEYGETQAPAVAIIREEDCIGCTFCIKACPVDAIIGAPQQMHSVLEQDCTGCELCLEPCPVDCIDMVPLRKAQNTIKTTKKNIDNKIATACIRCFECEISCPKALAPQELFWQKDNNLAMVSLGLDSCIECRICDRVCPSHIPLTNIFIETKNRLEAEKIKIQEATKAETQFLARETRLIAKTKTVKTRASQGDRANILADLKNNKQKIRKQKNTKIESTQIEKPNIEKADIKKKGNLGKDA